MLYLLPTRGSTPYRGKRPNGIRSMSTSPKSFDKDGRRCMHFETNCGERYTATFDRLELENYAVVVGKQFHDILKNGTVVNTMSQTEYDNWLVEVRRAREA